MKLFTSNSGNNHGRWKNRLYDDLLERAARELDSKKRIQLYDEAQRLLTETDAAIVPLYWKAEATVLNPKFSGLEYNSMARMDLRHVRPANEAQK
jgi:oligopeptide transport system substrate-binding protein